MEVKNKKHSILVIDDEKDILLVLSNFLGDEGFKVYTSESGKDGLQTIQNEDAGMVLLDISMPEMNGIEVLSEIRKIKPELPIIMITAYRDAEKVVEAFRLGAFDCIFKPFDLKSLRKSIMAKLIE